jgi:hypothetical protein
MAKPGPELDLLASIEAGTVDRKIQEFAARGFVPLPPAELVRAVASIIALGDPALVVLAEETFRGFGEGVLLEAVKSEGVRSEQLDVIAHRCSLNDVLEPLIRAKVVSDETLAWLAERIPPFLQEILITNQTRLLASPIIVERLFENQDLSSDIRRRADEFLEEFFLKKIRAEEEAEGLLEAKEEVLPEATEAEEKLEAPHTDDPDELPPDDDKIGLFGRILKLTVVQRIRMAYKGSREERLFLVRDKNRLVSSAVLKSPKTNEADGERIANMKNVGDEVLRAVGARREWTKKYSIVLALTRNPRTPVATTIPLIARLTKKDQKTLATDRNIPEVVRVTARRAVATKEA